MITITYFATTVYQKNVTEKKMSVVKLFVEKEKENI